ncbi:MAG TPA: hypothetical protein VF796_17330, partial [Humisphaera sp.]
MIVFPCHVCRTDLSAEEAQVGQLVRCPKCMTTLRVPGPAGDDPAAALAAMTTPPTAPAPGAPAGGPYGQYPPPPGYPPPAYPPPGYP